MFDCILFDLDGTLIDTNDLVIKSYQHTIRTHLGQDWGPEKFIPYFGEPLIYSLERFAPGQAEELIQTYRSFNLANHDALAKEIAGIHATLQVLHQKGITLGVVTSKLKLSAQRGLGLFGLKDFFQVFVAYEDTEQHKPEAAPILHALNSLQHDTDGVLYVGDSTYDIRCAKAAGVKSAAVMWSAYEREVLLAEQPDYILENVSDLLQLI
ncbi:MAG: pyrophosphatase PpaX [Peptococcaceae bacterium]|nr:pyrophosphatase PpaX [Peptococcaceae bacterium]